MNTSEQSSANARTVAFILTSQAELGATGQKSGSWLEEIAAAYYAVTDSGHAVTFVSIQGGAAPIDPASTAEGPHLTDAGKRFLADDAAMSAVRSTCSIGALDATTIDAVYLVGGTGVMWDFPENACIAKLLEQLDQKQKPIAAVCHGVAGLLNGPRGKPIVAGRRITVISDKEDEMFGVAGILPFLPESRFRSHDVQVVVGAPFERHVVRDGHFVTGQNPASAAELGNALVELLNKS